MNFDLKLGKILMVLALGLFMALAALNNVLTLGDSQFSANSAVAFAIGMQETGQHPNVMWRAIDSSLIVGLGVFFIIVTEAIAGVLGIWGAVNMWKARSLSAEEFNASKTRGMQGLTLMAVFYLLAFQTIVGEWFMVWQTGAPTLEAAFINFAMAMLVLMWVKDKDD